ncbi:MAG TPA: alpha/beta fold hydrolase [Vicinamibacterales bacterium]|jgi:pimeloyl-ACP methyl ester carboxylesterase|nr:alpha/beta fold hydrolase [Vicinamibacterales bacterium]
MQKKSIVALALALTAGLAVSAQPGSAGKDVTVLGFRLHYIEAGRGAPVVLLHGLGGDGSRWGPNVEALARDFHVFALDQIGFGQSDKPLANYHTGMLAEFLAGFLKAVNVPKASLVGNSMGAGVALYTAVYYPDLVDRLVLADGGGYRRAEPGQGPPVAPSAAALHRRQIQNSVTRDETREFFRVLFHDKSLVTDKLVDDQLAMRLRSAFTITKIQEAGEKGLGSLSESQVRGVKAPTLVVWGKYDELADPAGADRLEHAIPGARKVMIDNCGHMPQLERPEEFNRLVRDFLGGAQATHQ